jgi:hypothetical protein
MELKMKSYLKSFLRKKFPAFWSKLKFFKVSFKNFYRSLALFKYYKKTISYSRFKIITKIGKSAGGRQIVNDKGFLAFFTKNSFFSFHARPKKASDIKTISFYKSSKLEFALIIQGPVITKDDFTLESIRLYKRNFPNACIILSTWKDTPQSFIDAVNNENIVLLLNDPPEKLGLNLNLQTKSTLAGLKYAASKNIKFSMKTRADWRFYSGDILPYLISMTEIFPTVSTSQQKRRIVVSDMMTCKHRVYGITDTFLFGETEDLFKYWDVGYWEDELIEHFDGQKIINSTAVIGEIFLCARYLKKIGYELDWTLDSWWDVLKKYFIVVDSSGLDIFWYKYDFNYEKRYTKSYVSLQHRTISFEDWLSLNTGKIDGWHLDDAFQEKWGEDEFGNLKSIMK